MADDPSGVPKSLTPSNLRILQNIEQRCKLKLLEFAGGQRMTREFMEKEVEAPLVKFLPEEVKKGNLSKFGFFVDKSESKRMKGICNIELSVILMEKVNLTIEVPEFKREPEK